MDWDCVQVHLPIQSYTSQLNRGRLSEADVRQLEDACNEHPGPVLLAGAGQTAAVIRGVLADRVMGMYSSTDFAEHDDEHPSLIVLATGPTHYPELHKALDRVAEWDGVPRVEVFQRIPEVNVRAIVESQPRSGTFYLINNLRRCINAGYASSFGAQSERKLRAVDDGVYLDEGWKGDDVVVMSHFFRPLLSRTHRYAPRIFVASYIPDAFVSWARLLAGKPDRKIKIDGLEWSILRGFMDEHVQWLGWIRDKFVIRYEDFYKDFDGTMARLSAHLGGVDMSDFQKPKEGPNRIFWGADWTDRMDEDVRAEIFDRYGSLIEHFWPDAPN